VESLTRLLDPDVAGDVDLGADGPGRSRRGRDRVSAGLLSFLGPQSGTTLVSQPINGNPGVLAFRGRQVEVILVFTLRDGLIRDIHAIADRRKLALVTTQLG
jgi:hypothetical protein